VDAQSAGRQISVRLGAGRKKAAASRAVASQQGFGPNRAAARRPAHGAQTTCGASIECSESIRGRPPSIRTSAGESRLTAGCRPAQRERPRTRHRIRSSGEPAPGPHGDMRRAGGRPQPVPSPRWAAAPTLARGPKPSEWPHYRHRAGDGALRDRPRHRPARPKTESTPRRPTPSHAPANREKGTGNGGERDTLADSLAKSSRGTALFEAAYSAL